MKPLINAIAIALIGFFIHACSPVPYAVIGHNTPLLQNKNEVNLNVSLNSGTDAAGFGVQTAWAFDSAWALMSSFYSMESAVSWDEPQDWNGKGRYFEIGVGSFGKSKRNSGLVYEGFFGTGFTRIRNDYDVNKLDVNYMNIFLQGSIGYSVKWLDMALTPRIGYMHYTNKNYSFEDSEYQHRADIFFRENNSKILFEPGFTVRVGYKSVKFSVNYVTSTFTTRGDFVNKDELQINSDFISFGLNYVITKRFKE
jgi:hypothetical protein